MAATYRCLRGLSSSTGTRRGPCDRRPERKRFGCEAFGRKRRAEEDEEAAGWVSPSRTGDSAPGRWRSAARTVV